MTYAETELHKHYVSVVDGTRRGLLYGPFDTRREAEANVELVRKLAQRLNSDAWFYGFGTARVTLRPGQTARPGLLNDRIRDEAAADGDRIGEPR